jgi:hypothetical protein
MGAARHASTSLRAGARRADEVAVLVVQTTGKDLHWLRERKPRHPKDREQASRSLEPRETRSFEHTHVHAQDIMEADFVRDVVA